MGFNHISTRDLLAQVSNPEFIILDIRPAAAYNGWKLKDEVRGGHIRGAVSFPISWVNDLSDSDLQATIQSKGIVPEKMVVIYGYKRDNFSKITRMLQNVGIRNILVYASGLQNWAADSALPMDHLASYEKLVYPEWVERIISGKDPNYFFGESAILFEVSYEGFEKYKAGHIPGAYHFDLASIECAPSWNICSNDELFKILLSHGITHTSTVVLYSRNIMAVARIANAIMYAGVEDVRILDGGIDAWLKAGFDVEDGVRQPTPVNDFGLKIPGHPEYLIDIDSVKELLKNDQGVLVSVRSWDEYIGKTSGYDYIKTKGHIAGAVWGHSGSDPHHMEDYRNPDGTMRSYHEIESNWRKVGITPDKKIAFYCGTGWRASETFFYAYLMGWQNISVYDGGWLEWSQDATNPISFGAP